MSGFITHGVLAIHLGKWINNEFGEKYFHGKMDLKEMRKTPYLGLYGQQQSYEILRSE